MKGNQNRKLGVAAWLATSVMACGGGGVGGPVGPDTSHGTLDVAYNVGGDLAPDGVDLLFDGMGFGDFVPCTKGSDCPTGFCVEGPDGQMVCAPDCVEGVCPPGWVCRQVANLVGDVVFVCLPEVQRLCRPCRLSEECRPTGAATKDLCVRFGDLEGSFCGRDCSDTRECPSGYECREVESPDGSQAWQCLPKSGVCECSADSIEAGHQTNCLVSNEFGKCPGVRICTKDGLTECNAPTPAPEVCNGADDDCDGQTDEDLSRGSCTLTNQHGSCPGVLMCIQGEARCTGTEATAETCNGKDDDCDGHTDEGGASGCETYFYDADGDGWGLGTMFRCLCSPAPPYSATKVTDCDDANDAINPASREACNGRDDNCDGQTDEEGASGCNSFYKDADNDGFGVQGDSKCLCNPTGPYKATTGDDCDDLNAAIKPGATETCNGKDDNCNGQTDEGDVCQTTYKIGVNPDDGGSTGACGCNNLCEDNLNLSMGLHLRDFLNADTANLSGGGTWQVFMTRTDDSNPSLASRAAYLNNNEVHRAISISCNTTPEPCPNDAVGTETYVKTGAGPTTNDLAAKVQVQVASHFQTKDRGVKIGNYYMLVNTNMPHVFVFVGFLTNPAEATKLNTDSWRKEAARGMLHGIQQHFGYGEFNP